MTQKHISERVERHMANLRKAADKSGPPRNFFGGGCANCADMNCCFNITETNRLPSRNSPEGFSLRLWTCEESQQEEPPQQQPPAIAVALTA